MTRLQIAQSGPEDLLTDLGRVLVDLLLLHRIDGRDDGGSSERVTGVGQTTREHAIVEGLRDVRGDDHTAHGDITGVRALREHDQVGLRSPVLEREPLAGAREAGHGFVGDPDDLVLVGECAHAFEVAGRGNEDAGGAHDGFEDDRADGSRSFELDHLLEVLQRAFGLLLGAVRPER